MTTYYLIPTKWETSGANNRFDVCETGEGIRTFEGSQKTARAAAQEYERSLNNGADFDIERIATEKVVMIEVMALPYSEARDYRRFCDWPCNQEDSGQEALVGKKYRTDTEPTQDLLEACKALLKNTRDAVDPYNRNRQFYGALPKYFKAVEAAMAKTEGE